MSAVAREQAVLFGCHGDELIGILHQPSVAAETGVVVIVGGPQYRAGSHRQFVQLARALAAAGYPTLRFDYRGMGDSSGAMHSFEDVSDDIGAAIDALLERLPRLRQVVLWGLCDGASAALLYCDRVRDARVQGVCAANPWVRSEASLVKTQLKHYYRSRLLQLAFWRKAFSGRVSAAAVAELLGNLKQAWLNRGRADLVAAPASYQRSMARGWQNLRGRVLLILSSNDYTAKEFTDHAASDTEWRQRLSHVGVVRHELAGADHTFSQAAAAQAVEQLTVDWVARMAADGALSADVAA